MHFDPLLNEISRSGNDDDHRHHQQHWWRQQWRQWWQRLNDNVGDGFIVAGLLRLPILQPRHRPLAQQRPD
jgi:hypothetical protein